jgi:hypothetical protein
MGQALPGFTYQLHIAEDGKREARIVEFDASGSDVALRMAQQFCDGRSAQLFEDGRRLANLQLDPEHGFWMID